MHIHRWCGLDLTMTCVVIIAQKLILAGFMLAAGIDNITKLAKVLSPRSYLV